MAWDALRLRSIHWSEGREKYTQNETSVELLLHLDFMAVFVSGLPDPQGGQDEHHGSPETSACKMSPRATTAAEHPIIPRPQVNDKTYRPRPNVGVAVPSATLPSGVRCLSGLKVDGSGKRTSSCAIALSVISRLQNGMFKESIPNI